MPWTYKIEACPSCGKKRRIQTCRSRRLCKDCSNAINSRRGAASNLFKHGGTGRTEFVIWCSMRQRCMNPKHPAYADYGGRGIRICERWNKFKNFLKDMGPRPKGKSLDRRNNDGDYTPRNCRWATRFQQARNRRPRQKLTLERWLGMVAHSMDT